MDITLLCVLVGPSFDVSGNQKAALNWPEMFNPDWVWVFRRYWHKAPRPHAWEMRPVFRAPLAIVQTSPSVASQTRGLMLALSKFECWLYESHKFVWVTSILVVTRFLRHSGIPFWPMNSCIILERLGMDEAVRLAGSSMIHLSRFRLIHPRFTRPTSWLWRGLEDHEVRFWQGGQAAWFVDRDANCCFF